MMRIMALRNHTDWPTGVSMMRASPERRVRISMVVLDYAVYAK